MKNSLKYVLPGNVTTRVIYLGTRLSSKFAKIKDKTVKEHQHDIVYYINVQKISTQKTILEKRHKDCQKEYLTIIVEMLNPIW